MTITIGSSTPAPTQITNTGAEAVPPTSPAVTPATTTSGDDGGANTTTDGGGGVSDARKADFKLQGNYLQAKLNAQVPSTVDGTQTVDAADGKGEVWMTTAQGNKIYYNPDDPNGVTNAVATFNSFDGDNNAMARWFGTKPLTGENIHVDPSQGNGAIHEVPEAPGPLGDLQHLIRGPYDSMKVGDAPIGSGAPIAPGLSVAEQMENYEWQQDKGWNPGKTNGESLSQLGELALHPENAGIGLLPQEQSAWFNQYGRAWMNGDLSKGDFLSNNDAADTNFQGNGQGTLFLQWLETQTDKNGNAIDIGSIARAGGDNLADTYYRLTGNEPALGLERFSQALKTLPTNPDGTLALPASAANPFQEGSGTGDK